MQLNDERVRILIQLAEDVPLAYYLFDSIHISISQLLSREGIAIVFLCHHYFVLVDNFHCIELSRAFVSDHQDFGKRSLA